MADETKPKPEGPPSEKAAEPPTSAVSPGDKPVTAPEKPAAAPEKPAAPAAKPAAGAEKPAAAPPAKPAVAAGDKPAPAAKPAAPPKPGPVPLDSDLLKRYKARFGDAIQEASEDRKQAILVVDKDKLLEIALYTRDEEKFNLLTDLTAVDWPKRERRFDVVLNLYSFEKNERLRIKAYVGENEKVASVCSVWPTANWLERECYDMFGIAFDGHPELKRILLPDEWQGYPLRKDYDILQQDTDWVKENLGIESGQ